MDSVSSSRYPTKGTTVSSKLARQKKDRNITSLGLPLLLDDLIIEILLRLPVKSLLRFLLVCPGWYTIIKSPRFIHDHCHRGSSSTSNLVHCQERDDEREIRGVTFCSVFPDGTLERYEVPQLSGQCYEMHGSCCGIICVSCENDIISLWNPATRKLRPLPSCPIEKLWNFAFGFGLDPITNDLKIVLINVQCQIRQFFVYNSTKDFWKLFEEGVLLDPDCCLMPTDNGCTFSNGVSYWVKIHRTTDKSGLLAFDMRNDSFQELEMPEISHKRGEMAALDFIDDTLALLVLQFSVDPQLINVWLMKERGCWTKHKTVLLNFDCSSIFGIWKGNQIFTSVASSDGGEELILYDQDFSNPRSLEKLGTSTFIFRYKESLL